ncbi:excinuclease ABC subunit B [Candidatus Gottesmanbacteria bacterium RIFCSPLOWO2_01_FULL_39_12b]|uniref:UvrABC system protein B n=1 Tax=Candidatus Gottesmanbacteria bacterium RIFCSPLOWO2_01_FULL_39_12b TaxID=1798388 RepID=A0A1F6AQB7_9BACT|nr:MAG: excinuclease ABC subunit B [Candidatus Gottesmanbacteria bacterium RIFCSPLOWO2_01_FULL_39_12b]
MMKFKLKTPFSPSGDQPQAINSLINGLKLGLKNQVLLGVTGSGKTYTIANVIEKIQRPTLVISHNKTLAAQLYQEFRDFFPDNAICYFVSYYDYYQPEAYIPQSDTYIEKETQINEEIDKLRLSATANLLSRKDTIVVASVSCIYNLGSPKVYGSFILELKTGIKIEMISLIKRLVDLHYVKSDFEFKRGLFRTRGESLDIFTAYEDIAYRIIGEEGKIKELFKIDPVSGHIIEQIDNLVIFPAKHYMTDPKSRNQAFEEIKDDLRKRVNELETQKKDLEAHRLSQRVNYDLEMIEELGFVNGIENYSRYFDNRRPGEAPWTLLDYYKEKYGEEWLLIIDESHMTVPQVRGMYNGDRSRKQTLIDFGFRLPSALDNRPLNFVEFQQKIPQTIYVSATPNAWETSLASATMQRLDLNSPTGIVEQLVRPTGITDPEIIIRPIEGQISDLTHEIIKRKKLKERVLVTTLTKKTAEDLAAFFQEKRYLKTNHNISESGQPLVQYLHCDIETLERSDILDDLRLGKYDVLIGINLLREGLDLPEVSLVAILDADKEGFLRSQTSLIQTMGRAARHIKGKVIMYADQVTRSMDEAIREIKRRRTYQQKYNRIHDITPAQITKPIRDKLIDKADDDALSSIQLLDKKQQIGYDKLLSIDTNQLTPIDIVKLIKVLEKEMKLAASDLNFELAATLRDKIRELNK